MIAYDWTEGWGEVNGGWRQIAVNRFPGDGKCWAGLWRPDDSEKPPDAPEKAEIRAFYYGSEPVKGRPAHPGGVPPDVKAAFEKLIDAWIAREKSGSPGDYAGFQKDFWAAFYGENRAAYRALDDPRPLPTPDASENPQ